MKARSRNALCAVRQRDGAMTPYALEREPLVGGSPCRGPGMCPYQSKLIWLVENCFEVFCLILSRRFTGGGSS